MTFKSHVAGPDPAMGQLLSSDESIQMASSGPSSLNRASRDPFLVWELDRAWAPDCQDAKRMSTLSSESRESVWHAKRRHAPCSEKAPRGVGIDCIYLREDYEHRYVQNLIAGTTDVGISDTVEVDGSLIFFEKPFVPTKWSPAPQRYHGDPITEYPHGGDVFLARDSVPRDSGYAVYAAGVVGGLGVPGRLLREYRREWRHRRRGVLKAWSQTEYYNLPQHAKDSLYPRTPQGWEDAEVPARMYVPLPPVVTYRGSYLIRNDPLHWTIFRTEWTALVFGRWIADIHFRGLLWRLPRKVRGWINQLGVMTLLQGSDISATEVQLLLSEHDSVDWTQYEVIASDSTPEDGIVKIHVAPILYKKGKITLESLRRSLIPRLPTTTLSSPTVSASSRPPTAMADNRDNRHPPVPVLRSAPVATDPEDPYAPVPAAAHATSSLTMPERYIPVPRTQPPTYPYAVHATTPSGGARAVANVTRGSGQEMGDSEFGRLYSLLTESGHAHLLARWQDPYGHVGADSVLGYIHYLDSECRRLAARVRNLEEGQERLHEQLYEERRERVTWLSGALHDASQRMDEPPRKRRREFD
jgi:hypothetical protein